MAKGPYLKARIPMGSIIATKPREVPAMDFTQLEPASDGRENVLVLTDVFTKFTVAIPTRDQKAVTVAKALIREWFMVYGVPQRFHSVHQGTLHNLQHQEVSDHTIPPRGKQLV